MGTKRGRAIAEAFGRQRSELGYCQERAQSQLAFAQFLCARHPENGAVWKKLIGQAEAAAADAAGGGAAAREAVSAVENLLAPLSEAARRYTLYCVGHAHVDMNWMWSWPETVSATVDTTTTVLRLMQDFPEFVYSQSQASVYRILEEFAPELLAEIRTRVAEKRWEVTASHWVEGDKNMADGESLCRHLLYARQYMQELLGLAPEDVQIDWAPDTFGHAHSVPTYLVRGGVRWTYLHRPGNHTPPQPRPEAFWWQAPDGSRVLVRNDMRRGYNGRICPQTVHECLARFVEETNLPFAMFVYGIGDHGGGPTRRDLARLADMQQWPVFPTLQQAPASAFFERLEREGDALQTIDDELNFEFTGCFTSQSQIKRINRIATRRLVEAEGASTMASRVAGTDYPLHSLTSAWRDTLFSHFHDILPGSCVHDSRTFAHGMYQQVMARTAQARTRALRAIAARVDTSSAAKLTEAAYPVAGTPVSQGAGVGRGSVDGGLSEYDPGVGGGTRPLLIYNSLPYERTEIVEATVWDSGAGWEPRDPGSIVFGVRSVGGDVVRAQVVDSGNYWGHAFVRLAFPVTAPGMGYAVCVVEKDADCDWWGDSTGQFGESAICHYSYYERSPEGLQNAHTLVELDPQGGGIRRLVDRDSELTVMDNPQGTSVLEWGLERTRSMNAWLVQHTNGWQRAEVVSLSRGLSGPYKATLELRVRVRHSEMTVVYELRASDPALYLHVTGDWREYWTQQHGAPSLRLSLPLACNEPDTRYEIPFGAVTRRMQYGEEVPALRWVRAEGALADGARGGVCLVNDSTHGHSCTGNRLNLTLIRSTHNPDPLPEVGHHEVHCAVRPLSGTTGDDTCYRLAQAFDHEMVAVATDAHEGDLSPSAALLTVDNPSVVLAALKAPESGAGMLVRLVNPTDQPQDATVMFGEHVCSGVSRAACVDVLERNTGETVAAQGRTFGVTVPSRAFVSVVATLDH